jgi:hypothetical protein
MSGADRQSGDWRSQGAMLTPWRVGRSKQRPYPVILELRIRSMGSEDRCYKFNSNGVAVSMNPNHALRKSKAPS